MTDVASFGIQGPAGPPGATGPTGATGAAGSSVASGVSYDDTATPALGATTAQGAIDVLKASVGILPGIDTSLVDAMGAGFACAMIGSMAVPARARAPWRPTRPEETP